MVGFPFVSELSMVHTGITDGVLIVGGIIPAIVGTFHGILRALYAADHLGIQRFVVSLAAAVIALNLSLVMLFGYPFAGELSVSRRPFEIDIDIFDGLYDERPAHAAERSAVSD